MTDSEQRERQQYLLKWLEFERVPTEDDRLFDDIRGRVATIYSELNLRQPQIIPCRGPLEQAIFPCLIGLMLRIGRERSTNLNFCRTALESPAVHTEWANLWQEAIRLIDWTNATAPGTDTGALINDKIEKHLESLRPALFAQIDEEIGMYGTQELEKFFETELLTHYRRLKRAIMYGGVELQNFWGSFIMRLPESLPFTLDRSVQERWLGGWDWYWLAGCDFARQTLACKLSADLADKLDFWINLSLDAAGYLFYEHCCFVYLKPIEIFFDENDRLHHHQKAAVDFIDGTKFFFWHGMEVPEEIITNPQKMKIKAIENERNVELRRLMIERYGLDDFLRDSAARKIQEDECGTLYRKEMQGDEPMVVVKVTNSTPEPDGTFRIYFLRVPPNIRTARGAVAWTFGMREDDYTPIVET